MVGHDALAGIILAGAVGKAGVAGGIGQAQLADRDIVLTCAAVPISSRDNTAQSASFMEISDYTAFAAAKRALCAAAARTFAAGVRLANHEFLDLVAGL